MDRRRFLQLTGFSSASLLFTRLNAAGLPESVIAFPDTVSVLSAGQWISLTGNGDQWRHEAFEVKTRISGRAPDVGLRAPGRELEKVRLDWKRAAIVHGRILGDQYERSYGDLQWSRVGKDILKAPWYVLINDGTSSAPGRTARLAKQSPAREMAVEWKSSGI